MVTERLEVRLDEEHRRRLSEIASTRGEPVSQVVRELIDRCYEETLQRERVRAARELADLSLEDVPEPEVLARQLAESNEIPD